MIRSYKLSVKSHLENQFYLLLIFTQSIAYFFLIKEKIMDIRKSIILRRVGVFTSFLSLFLIVSVFEFCRLNEWSDFLIGIEIFSIIVLIISLFFTYFKTGLWSFSHRSLEKLDEREIALTSKSLRNSYAIFTVSILLLVMITSLAGFSVHMVTVSSLILFSHILPASVIAWSEKEV